ncbi:FKBP-type peptidylprolyl isomerase [Flavobacterium sp. ZT3R18]|uniref:FKBP-type peptidyl-prolyl cis-trans isomerase n=1 Tax=Flavobacterium sp. ZT3R18 TaxID=2594429 RepID=UPI001179CA83|nr:FKBP-type peptidyl-prolyl cis-trans isomerase [Flavobacterium sp. ZT3R18]TRX36422.1 FKBP-type peptidylprolyl isomerase [Flavobacterium sp. ZT3R18]
MSKIKFYFILLIATVVTICSCNKDDDKDTPNVPAKPFAEQYPIDSLAIHNYLKTHSIVVTEKPGETADQDVKIDAILVGGTKPSIWSYLNSPTFPKLLYRNVELHGITYKLYYLVIREGIKDVSGVGGESPSNVDAVFAAYKGTLLDGTVFDSSDNGQNQFNLDGFKAHDGGAPVITGWSEAFPKFKTGQLVSNTNGTVAYANFGSGMMFLPSGLGYYNKADTKIPAYSPLVFSVKLYSVKRFDHDADGIPSYQEDVDPFHDGYMYVFAKGVENKDDTDKDGIPDFLDFDDDGDGYATRGEIKDANGKYYPYDGALVDDPSTPNINETYGIPRKYSLKYPNLPESETNPREPKPEDFTDPARLRRHLDPTCFPPYQK